MKSKAVWCRLSDASPVELPGVHDLVLQYPRPAFWMMYAEPLGVPDVEDDVWDSRSPVTVARLFVQSSSLLPRRCSQLGMQLKVATKGGSVSCAAEWSRPASYLFPDIGDLDAIKVGFSVAVSHLE